MDIGAALPAATDADGDTLTYSLGGTNAASFTLDVGSRQLKTKAGVSYDLETKSSYSVTLEVSDGNGGTASLAVTVNVTDVAEDTIPTERMFIYFTEEYGENEALGGGYGSNLIEADCRVERYFRGVLD